MNDAAEAAEPYVQAILAEIRADAWLKDYCFQRLKAKPEYAKRTLQKEESVFRGRTFFPCLRQIYLLSRGHAKDRTKYDQTIEELATDSKYNRVKLRHYYDVYDGSILPQPFVRSFLANVADVSEASADSVLRSLACIGMIYMRPCEIDNTAKAVRIERDMIDCVETWMQMKNEGWKDGG